MKVPNGWELSNLDKICSKITDGSHHSPKSVEEGFPMYSVKDMNTIGFKENSARNISKNDYEKLVKQNCKPQINDILIAKDGSILKHCFVIKKNIDAVILSSIAILRPNLNKLFPEFIKYYLHQNYIKKYIAKVFTTGSGVPRIVLKDFKKIKLQFPPLPEQRKIAKILGCWDRAIAACEQLIATSKQQKQALMQQLLTAKKRFGEFSGEWAKIKLKDIANYRRGSFPQPYGNPEWVDNINGYPFIQVFDIDKNMRLKKLTKIKISNQAINKSVFIRKGTVIVSLQGSIGRVAITQYDAYVDRTILLFQDYKQNMNSLYFAYAIQELFLIEKEKAPGGTIKTITKEVLSNFTIKIPTLPEQQKIAQVLTAADSEIEILQQKLAKLQQEKQALMQQLLTGKRRVKTGVNN